MEPFGSNFGTLNKVLILGLNNPSISLYLKKEKLSFQFQLY
jgi:hypothetical protein